MTIHHFQHQHTAHCESGVMSTLLKHHGFNYSEPMLFGLSSALTFAYLPIIKLSGMPLIAYRMPPKTIIRNSCKRLGIKLNMQKFVSSTQGMQKLDQALDNNQLVGLQTSVFWLPYIPDALRFHFNAHNILVYGKKAEQYLISDPVMESPVQCSASDLERARFAKGALAGKGLMYTLEDAQKQDHHVNLSQVIRSAILKNARQMQAPLPFIGIKGIHLLANRIQKLKNSMKSDQYKKLYLGHIVRMQEEIGTGGAGFRYMYASFLQEAADHLSSNHKPLLLEAADNMTNIGDAWRKFASRTVKLCRNLNETGFNEVSELLHQVADSEKKCWRSLSQSIKKLA